MADMSTADINDLPDSDFAYIEPGGTKDASGKTTPRSLRHFPVHDAAHVRNALARMGSSPFGDKAKPKILAAAKKFGIDTSEEKAQLQVTELRKQRRSSMLAIPERMSLSFVRGGIEMRAKPNGSGGSSFRFEGYAATFDDPFDMWDPWGDPYTEIVRPGAFTRTLANSADVAFLIGHQDAGILMARTKSGTMTLAQDSRGLHVEVPAMDGSREDVRALASAVERGDMDEMSCAFVTRQQEWSPDYEQRSMLEMDLNRGDVSAVVFGANPHTAGSSMAALPVESLTLRRPVSVRGAFQVDTTDGPDYDPGPHAAPGHLKCPSPDCPVEGGALNSPDARFCDQCAAPLYSEDGTIILGDSGVPEQIEGDTATALARSRAELELRRRRLALALLSVVS